MACETVARERFDGDAARRAVVAPPPRFSVAPAAAPPLRGVTAFEELFGLVAARADGRDADEESRAEEDCAVAEEDDRTVPFGCETRFEGMTMRRSALARARRSSLLGRSSEGLRVAMGARTFRSGLLAASQLGGQGARRSSPVWAGATSPGCPGSTARPSPGASGSSTWGSSCLLASLSTTPWRRRAPWPPS